MEREKEAGCRVRPGMTGIREGCPAIERVTPLRPACGQPPPLQGEDDCGNMMKSAISRQSGLFFSISRIFHSPSKSSPPCKGGAGGG